MPGIKNANTGRIPVDKNSPAMMSNAISMYKKYFDIDVTPVLKHFRTKKGLKNLEYEIQRQKLKKKGLIKGKKTKN